MKLYEVTVKGSFATTPLGIKSSYVVANDPTEAYNKVRAFLDANCFGLRCERELETVELLAEETTYPDCKTRLFL